MGKKNRYRSFSMPRVLPFGLTMMDIEMAMHTGADA